MPTRPSAPHRQLHPDTIVATAMAIARVEGIAAVSMRRLAENLGVSAMALYHHIDDRESLLLRMLDVVAAGVGPLQATGEPRERLSEAMREVHRAFRRDPWVVQVLAADGLASPLILPAVEAIFAALADAGLGPYPARGAYLLLFQFVYGEVLVTQHDRPDSYARRLVGGADPVRFPRLAAIAEHVTAVPADHFEDNLARVLDGILGPR